ncbi:MAG: EamA family transporter [Bacteroidota bacterium]
MNDRLKQILELNLATLFISTSGVLGRTITVPVPLTVLIRCVIGIVFLWIILKLLKTDLKIDFFKHKWFFLFGGILITGHWVTYFYALQYSNVAIGMISLFTFPIITTFLEPLFFKVRISIFNLISSALVITGVVILVPEFSLGNEVTVGILFGILSALVYSIRNLLNKRYIKIYSGSAIMFYQLVISIVIMLPTLLIYPLEVSTDQMWLLLLLGLFTTALGHTLFLRSLSHFTASTASIIASLQPVYGIILGVILINETVEPAVYIGGSLILITVVAQSAKELLGNKSA